MPQLDGEGATKAIRSSETNAGVPIIGLTAHATSRDEQHFLAIGINGYVTKPIDRNKLYQEIARVIDNTYQK